MGDGFDRGREGGVAVEVAEAFVGRAHGLVVLPRSGGKRVVKKENSFWRKVDIFVS